MLLAASLLFVAAAGLSWWSARIVTFDLLDLKELRRIVSAEGSIPEVPPEDMSIYVADGLMTTLESARANNETRAKTFEKAFAVLLLGAGAITIERSLSWCSTRSFIEGATVRTTLRLATQCDSSRIGRDEVTTHVKKRKSGQEVHGPQACRSAEGYGSEEDDLQEVGSEEVGSEEDTTRKSTARKPKQRKRLTPKKSIARKPAARRTAAKKSTARHRKTADDKPSRPKFLNSVGEDEREEAPLGSS